MQRAIPAREFSNECSADTKKAMATYVREPNKIPPLEYAFGDDDALGPVSTSGLDPRDLEEESGEGSKLATKTASVPQGGMAQAPTNQS